MGVCIDSANFNGLVKSERNDFVSLSAVCQFRVIPHGDNGRKQDPVDSIRNLFNVIPAKGNPQNPVSDSKGVENRSMAALQL